MPAQSMKQHQSAGQKTKRTLNRETALSNVVLALMVLSVLCATTAYASALADAMQLSTDGTALHFLFVTVSSLAFSWVAFHAVNTVIGAASMWSGNGRDTISLAHRPVSLTSKNALLFPIYHEQIDDINLRISNLIRGLDRLDAGPAFDIFILSDSQDQSVVRAELRAFGALSRKFQSVCSVTYRNRIDNSGKKAGNIANWVKAFGARYDHFVIFDADSAMTPYCLLSLAATLEANSETGLIQTFPKISGAKSRFARLQQFANNLYGPISASGFAAWQGDSGNYWGHNAIIRTRAFAECAGLPMLSGRPPWGGNIQSHDFVEAALLRRAGWRVALVTSLPGSFEGCPPNLFEMAMRDRRWMQGNLQHLRILFMSGLKPISRAHMAFGVIGYLASALWLTMIAVGLSLLWHDPKFAHSYFTDTETLFPIWPVFDTEAGMRILIATAAVLFFPKVLGLVFAVVEQFKSGNSMRKIFKLLQLWASELIFSVLMAPVHMLLHVKGILEIVLSRDAGWKSQIRQGEKIDLRTALHFHRLHILTGFAIAVAAASLSYAAVAWLSPIVVGLIASPLVTLYLSRPCSHSTR